MGGTTTSSGSGSIRKSGPAVESSSRAKTSKSGSRAKISNSASSSAAASNVLPPAAVHHPFRRHAPTTLSKISPAPSPMSKHSTFIASSSSMPPGTPVTHLLPTSAQSAHGQHSPMLLPIVLFLLGLLALTVAIQTVRYFLAPRHRHLHVVLASSGAIFLGFCLMTLPSIDVYVTGTQQAGAGHLKSIYLQLFAITILWLSLVLPFSFFFRTAEEAKLLDKSEVRNQPSPAMKGKHRHHKNSLCSRIWQALKRTLVFFVVLAGVFLAGLIFRPGHEAWSAETTTQIWMERVFDTAHRGTEALLFITGIVTTSGYGAVILYTAYGMASLPLDLIRGYKDPEEERLQAETSLVKIRSKLRVLDRKSPSKDSRREHATRLKLRREASIAQQHVKALRKITDTGGSAPCKSFCSVTKSCRMVGGASLLVFSCVLASATLLSASDPGLESAAGCTSTHGAKAMEGTDIAAARSTDMNKNSTIMRLVCQAETGYLGTLLNKPRLLNPFDEGLVKLANYFPLDFITITGALLYMFIASLYGVFRLGFRCCVCISMYRFRRRATSASAILVFGSVCILVALALLVQIPVLAPKYATFGPQTADDQLHCSMSGNPKTKGSKVLTAHGTHCQMTQVAILLVQMTRGYPVFSHIFYLASWLFGVIVCLSFLIRGCCGERAPNFTEFDFDYDIGVEDDPDVEMSKGLLSSSPPSPALLDLSSTYAGRLANKYGGYHDEYYYE